MVLISVGVAPDWWQVKANMDHATFIAWKLEQAGYEVVCPHSEPWPKTVELILNAGKPGTPDIMAIDRQKLSKCDCVLMSGAWQHSEGCKMEYDHAKALGKTIYSDLRELLGV